ncbi:hypothetical protein KJ763_02330 [Patescibacteria group bacterium]|nr:hypothetical protein [Patescibacteria group bacterium]
MSLPVPLFIQDIFFKIWEFILASYIWWLPIFLIAIFGNLWVYYARSKFLYGLSWILLEVKLPREITKTPRAMEVFLNSLHITKDGNMLEKYWQGFLRVWFSLEIVGINGEVHFFIYTQKFFRNLIEAQLYAQYPDAEIVEAEDYTKATFPLEDLGIKWGCFGTEFVLTAEDAYPIRTYVDYGLHEALVKEEQKTDPITAFVELLGSLKQGEQIWFQILVRATKKDWKEEGKKLVDKLMERDKVLKEGEHNRKLSSGEVETIKAIERDVSKLGFDTGIRILYLANNESFNPINIPSMIGTMKQYNAVNLNGFEPANSTSVDYFLKKKREAKMKLKMINAYRMRSYFYMPYPKMPFVLNTEELATIYHFPGRVSETPTFSRIEAKKSEPPTNLPI